MFLADEQQADPDALNDVYVLVQGYVYAARCAAATLAMALRMPAQATALLDRASGLRRSFDRAFWCEEIGTFALALDGHKRRARVRTSNAGQCLFSGIVEPRRVARVVGALLDDDGFSGWGVRTLAAGQTRTLHRRKGSPAMAVATRR